MALIFPPIERAKILPDSNAVDLIWNVVTSDDAQTVVVHSPYNDTDVNGENSVSNAGAIYVGALFQIKQKIVSPNRASSANFGSDVAVSSDGRVIVVGAKGENSLTGGAYIVTQYNEAWTVRKRFVYASATTGDRYGLAVTVSDDIGGGNYIVAVAGPFNSTNQGYFQVYTYNLPNNTLTLKKTIAGSTGDYLGYVLEISGDGHTLLASRRILAGGFDDNHVGKVNVYYNASDDWSVHSGTADQTLTCSLGEADNNYYGISNTDSSSSVVYHPIAVNYDGTVIAVGGYGVSISGGSFTGMVDIWSGSAGAFTVEKTYSSTTLNKKFGGAVALNRAGDYLVIGSNEYDVTGNQNEGAFYYVYKSGSSWSASPTIVQADVPVQQSFYGFRLSLSNHYIYVTASRYEFSFGVSSEYYVLEYDGAFISATDVEVVKPVDYQIEEFPIRVPGLPYINLDTKRKRRG